MEVEIKLRLNGKHDYERLKTILGLVGCERTEDQVNHFYDTDAKHLAAAKVVMRLRVIDKTDTCYVTVKEGGVVVNGVSTAKETEERMVIADARHFMAASDRDKFAMLISITKVTHSLFPRVIPDSALQHTKLVHLGEYATHREKYPICVSGVHEQLKLELDVTTFPWGEERYEIEVEVKKPQNVALVKEALVAVLGAANIPYEQSTESKFSALMRGDKR